MNPIRGYFSKDTWGKLLAIVVLVALIFLSQGMVNILLLTFFLSFLLYTIQNTIFVRIRRLIKIDRSFITVGIFAIIVLGLFLTIYKYIPKVIWELSSVVRLIGDFNIYNLKGQIDDRLLHAIMEVDITGYIKEYSNTALRALSNIGRWGVDIFIAFILSFFFVIEKDEIVKFGSRFENSKLSGAFSSLKYFINSFINSFAKVMQAQLIIATVNAILSLIGLYFLGFPQVLGLTVMIFILGLVPVAGVWISLVPLSIIAFRIGGPIKIVHVIVMIIIIHALEAYVLNPKIMSINTKLPVFMTFLILLVSEHLMGVWGLLFGIPIFMFLLDILDIKENK